MQGSPAGPVLDSELAGRRALDFVCRLLNGSDAARGLQAIAADLSESFGASAAGLASLDGGAVTVRARAGAADSPRLPWEDNPELADQARATPTALSIARHGGGSVLLCVAAAPDDAGWLLWVEDARRDNWEHPLPSALHLAGQALLRRPLPEDARPRWAAQVDRVARQQRLEGAAAVARRLAHDFGNILTGILGFSELSLTQNVSPDSALHRYLLEVHRGAQAGASFTHQLRLFSRRHPVSPRSTSLAAVVRDEETRVRLLWADAPYRFALSEELPAVAIDADHLRQVIAALLDNAREAAGAKGMVQFNARCARLSGDDCLDYYGDPRPGEHVEIVVTDDGPGIAPEVRTRLFAEPFLSTKPRRRGLGLATVYGILHAHRGGIQLAPGSHGGIWARAVLPIATEAAAAPTAEEAPAAPGEKVLVVDDDPRLLQFVASTLERAGYRVRAVGSAGEALDCYDSAGKDPFRLVLSDVLMPEVNGVDLARRLRGRNPDVRVLFMSGHVGPDFPRQELEGWQFELLPKPFRVDGLLRAVRGALDRSPPRRPQSSGSGEGPMCSNSR
jgi:signal transduction histidine kinase/ActR/RegA family two-component response regulator